MGKAGRRGTAGGGGGRSSGASGIIFTLQSLLRYESPAPLLRNVRAYGRPIDARSHGNSRIGCVSYCLPTLRACANAYTSAYVHTRTPTRVYTNARVASWRLDRGRPNVKRNFTARLRTIALSLTDTPARVSKLLLHHPRRVATRNYVCSWVRVCMSAPSAF